MGRAITKENLTKVKLTDKIYGRELRASYQNEILKDEPLVPKKIEYDDIDSAINEMVEKNLEYIDDGLVFPTFTLFSNQRFSEYSQTWKHTDDDGNLLMNFKTIMRENNPSFGNNQGGNYAIPGERKYTVLVRDILEDNGDESYEVHSIRQPITVSLKYKVSLFTDRFANLNAFNMKINSLFKARQFYIRPNGHYIPVTLESIGDETTYGVDERKFFCQTYTLNVEAYIIRQEDIEIEKFPKRKILRSNFDAERRTATVHLSENGDELKLTITFPSGVTRVEFDADFGFVLESMEISNIRRIKTDMGYGYTDLTGGETSFGFAEGDNVKFKIIPVSHSCIAEAVLYGIAPKSECQ